MESNIQGLSWVLGAGLVAGWTGFVSGGYLSGIGGQGDLESKIQRNRFFRVIGSVILEQSVSVCGRMVTGRILRPKLEVVGMLLALLGGSERLTSRFEEASSRRAPGGQT